ncbi:MAG: T9SS type A sorting domain-containing protein, partial [Saprospiraceae bacterium]|nr:T9SS type A sorting domain-containing protein [Saprospiraceae bacterium]
AFGNDPITQQDGWIVKMDSEGQSCDDSPDCLLVNIAEVEASGKAQLTVSPNPANDQALLYYYLPKVLSNCSIEVYDLNGRLVFSELHQQASQEYGVQLDVSAWPSGMYVVQLRSEEGVLLASSLLVRG